MSNLFASRDKFRQRASLRFQTMNALAQIIGEGEHLLKRPRQLRQVFQAVTARAKLRPSERIRSSTDAVDTVTLGAVEPWCVWPSRDVTAVLEKLEGRAMTFAAHFERRARIRPGNEMTRVSFGLLRLRGIAAVATIARDAHAAVRAGFIDRNDLTRLTLQPAMAIVAVVLALGGDRGRPAKERGAGQPHPEPENDQ